MATHIYFNLMEQGHVHYGIFSNGRGRFYRTAIPGTTHRLDAFVFIRVFNGFAATWDVLKNIVEMGLENIGEIQDRTYYIKESRYGILELLSDDSRFSDVDEIMELLRQVQDSLLKGGEDRRIPGKTAIDYSGLPMRMLQIFHQGLRNALEDDDKLPEGEYVHGVREYEDYKEEVRSLENEMYLRHMDFEPLDL